MRFACGVIAILSIFVSGVQAADIAKPEPKAGRAPVEPAYDWSGAYLGVSGGWAKGAFEHSFETSGRYNLFPGDTFGYRQGGAALGGQLGYNWQAGQWVIGLETAMVKTWIDSGEQASPFFPATDTWKSTLDWMATATGRAGFASNTWLAFVKGGLALASFHDQVQNRQDYISVDLKRIGWTIGGGIEYAIATNWVLGVEYNYYDLGLAHITSPSISFGGGSFSAGFHRVELTVQSVLARASYKFGGYGKTSAQY